MLFEHKSSQRLELVGQEIMHVVEIFVAATGKEAELPDDLSYKPGDQILVHRWVSLVQAKGGRLC